MSHLRYAAAAVVLAIAAGCGSTVQQHTTTITAKQAARQERQTQNWQVGQPVPQAPSGPTVIECGRGLVTNGSCVFAERVAAQLPHTGLVTILNPDGTTNPMTCTAAPSGWRCQSRRSPVWVQKR